MKMPSPLRAVFLLLATIASLATGNNICPQVVANDPSPVFCAMNVYGSFNVRRSEFENWNCNHPFNKYTQSSFVACDPVATPPTCMPATCDNAGPTVCARLPSPSRPLSYTTAIFGNLCQLTLYNCMNPTQRYIQDPTVNPQCKSPGL